MDIGLHDNWLYAHMVDHDSRTIILHTMYPHGASPEFTDVIFEEVLVHHFETQCMRPDSGYPSNVLFDIEEEDATTTLGRYWEIISPKRNYGWPATSWKTMDELAAVLTTHGHRCFHIHGTVGLDGFVFARTMNVVARPSKWTNEAQQAAPSNDG